MTVLKTDLETVFDVVYQKVRLLMHKLLKSDLFKDFDHKVMKIQ